MSLLKKKIAGLKITREELTNIVKELKILRCAKGILIGFKDGIPFPQRRYMDLEHLQFKFVHGDQSTVCPNVDCKVIDLVNTEEIPDLNRAKKYKWEHSKYIKKSEFAFTFFGLDSLEMVLEYKENKNKYFGITGTKIDYGKYKDAEIYEKGPKCFSFEISPYSENSIVSEYVGVPGSLVGIPCPPLWDPKGEKKSTHDLLKSFF